MPDIERSSKHSAKAGSSRTGEFTIFEELESGLLLGAQKLSSTQVLVEIGSNFTQKEVGEGVTLYLPEGEPNHSDIQHISESELLKYSQIPQEQARKKTSTEIAQARYAPTVYLANIAEKALGAKATPQHREVLTNLRTSKTNKENRMFRKASLKQVEEKRSYFDAESQKRIEYSIKVPGALESVALIAVSQINDPDFKGHTRDIVFSPPLTLFHEYRVHAAHSQEAFNMPHLSKELLNTLEHGDRFPRATRFGAYLLLEQIRLNIGESDQLLNIMDKNKDLSHPLAFELTLKLAVDHPESEWIRLQEERREALLAELENIDPQTAFDRFDELYALSKQLVYSGNPLSPVPGKIGLEIEGILHNRVKRRKRINPRKVRDEQKDFNYIFYTLPTLEGEWEIHKDYPFTEPSGDELTRDPSALTHNKEYLHSLVSLRKWLADSAQRLDSLHVHLDNMQHPNKPDFGALFSRHGVSGEIDSDSIVSNIEHDTHEIRAFMLPALEGSMHPARLEDLINLLIHSSGHRHKPHPQRINIPENEKITDKRLLFGHISRYVSSPEGKLAALMSLHDDLALKGYNPKAFIKSFRRAAYTPIVNALKGKLGYTGETALGDLQYFNQRYYKGDTSIWEDYWPQSSMYLLRLLDGNIEDFYEIYKLGAQDKNVNVQHRALIGILSDESKESISLLKDLLSDEKTPIRTLKQCIVTLSGLPKRETRELFTNALRCIDPDVCQDMLHSLALLHNGDIDKAAKYYKVGEYEKVNRSESEAEILQNKNRE